MRDSSLKSYCQTKILLGTRILGSTIISRSELKYFVPFLSCKLFHVEHFIGISDFIFCYQIGVQNFVLIFDHFTGKKVLVSCKNPPEFFAALLYLPHKAGYVAGGVFWRVFVEKWSRVTIGSKHPIVVCAIS